MTDPAIVACLVLSHCLTVAHALCQITTGAGGDLQQVTNMAKAMVTQFGMSDIGPWALQNGQEQVCKPITATAARSPPPAPPVCLAGQHILFRLLDQRNCCSPAANGLFVCPSTTSVCLSVSRTKWSHCFGDRSRALPEGWPLFDFFYDPPPPPRALMPDCGVHYLWFAFVCFLIRSPHPPPPEALSPPPPNHRR